MQRSSALLDAATRELDFSLRTFAAQQVRTRLPRGGERGVAIVALRFETDAGRLEVATGGGVFPLLDGNRAEVQLRGRFEVPIGEATRERERVLRELVRALEVAEEEVEPREVACRLRHFTDTAEAREGRERATEVAHRQLELAGLCVERAEVGFSVRVERAALDRRRLPTVDRAFEIAALVRRDPFVEPCQREQARVTQCGRVQGVLGEQGLRRRELTQHQHRPCPSTAAPRGPGARRSRHRRGCAARARALPASDRC